MSSEPLLSVIVPAYKVEQFLDECLHSIREQRLRDIEIIVVDDGSPDKVSLIAKRHAKQDARVRLIRRPNGGLSAARTTGIEQSRGRYLTFVDSDDVVTAAGFEAAVSSLEKSGSDFAMMPYRQFSKAGLHDQPPWIAQLYQDFTVSVKPAARLDVLVQATAWSKVYRRDFWNRAELIFRDGVLYEDQEVSATAFANAETIDLVPVECYWWRQRGGSITREATRHSISQFFAAVHLAFEHLKAVPGAVAERARQLLANDVPRYLRALAKVEDEGYRRELFAGIHYLWPFVERQDWLRETPAEAKILETLVVADRMDDVARFIARGGFDLAQHEFLVLPEGPALAFPFFDELSIDRAAFVLSERQTPADARALRVVLDDSGVDIEFMAYLRHLDTGKPTARAWIFLNDEPVRELKLERVEGVFGHRLRTTRASNERSVWRTRFAWPDTSDGQAVLTLRVEVTHLNRTSVTTLSLIDPAGSAAWPQRAGGWQWSGTEPARWVRAGSEPLPAPPQHGRISVFDLPVDTDEGWWGLNAERQIEWTQLSAAERERSTFWWNRDHREATMQDPES